MPSNKVVADKSAQIKKSTFDMGHDYNATLAFGECVPTNFMFLNQPSHSFVKHHDVVRMFPLAVPTLGRIKVETVSNFIPIGEVFPKWKNVFSNTTSLVINANDVWEQRAISSCPTITARDLNYLFNHCCKLNVRTPYIYNTPSSGVIPPSIPFAVTNAEQSVRNGNWLNCCYNGAMTSSNVYRAFLLSLMISGCIEDRTPRSPDYYDQKNLWKKDGSIYFGCHKMNSKGRRVKKILDSLGYRMSFAQGSERIHYNLLPLLAWYRAYFINYLLPLQNYHDWENTACYKLIESISHESGNFNVDFTFANFDSDVNRKRVRLLVEFFTDELPFCVYTDNTLESACLNGSMLDKKMSVNPFFALRTPANFASNGENVAVLDGGSSSRNVLDLKLGVKANEDLNMPSFSMFELEVLKRMYVYVGRNSLMGAEIEKELIARGLRDFCDSCGCKYLGTETFDIEIGEVQSLSDTATTDSGSVVGEPYGRGYGRDSSRSIVFDNAEPGFFFQMTSIVPLTRGVQNINLQLLQTDNSNWYNPMFDGLGYEALPEGYLSYFNEITDTTDSEVLNAAFGLLPRYSGLKSLKNVSAGGFSNPSELGVYQPYCLDSFALRNPCFGRLDSNKLYLDYTVGFGPNDGANDDHIWQFYMPTSGIHWTNTLLSAFYGNLDRIFNARAYKYAAEADPWKGTEVTIPAHDYDNSSYTDGFIFHKNIVYDLTAQMLPLSLSYSCSTDDTNSKVEI